MFRLPSGTLQGPLDRKRWKEAGLPVDKTRSLIAWVRSLRIPDNVLDANALFWKALANDLAFFLATLRPGRGRPSAERLIERAKDFRLDAENQTTTWKGTAKFLAGEIAGLLPKPVGAPDDRNEIDKALGTKPAQSQIAIVEEARRLRQCLLLTSKAALRRVLAQQGYKDDPRFFKMVNRISYKPRQR